MLNVPTQITAGDTVIFFSTIPDYNPGSYTLSISFRGAVSLDVTAIPESNKFKTTITSVESAALTEGKYYWQAYCTNGDNERFTVECGQVEVKANFIEVTTPFDGRTSAQQMLDAVEAAIKGILENGAIKEYRIKEREMTKQDIPDLIMLRDKLRVEVAREKAANAGNDSRKLYIRFRG